MFQISEEVCECANDVKANGVRSFLEKIFFVLKQMGDSDNDQNKGVGYDYNEKNAGNQKDEELKDFRPNFIQWNDEKRKSNPPSSNWAKFDYRGSKDEGEDNGLKFDYLGRKKENNDPENGLKFDSPGWNVNNREVNKGKALSYHYADINDNLRNPEDKNDGKLKGLSFHYDDTNKDDDKLKGLSFHYDNTNSPKPDKSKDILNVLLQALFAKKADFDYGRVDPDQNTKRKKREISAILFSSGVFGIKLGKQKKLRGVSYDYKDIGKTSLSKDNDQMSSNEETEGHGEDVHKMKNLQGVSYDYRNIGKTSLSANDALSQEAGSLGHNSLKPKKLRGVSYDYKGIDKTSLSNYDDQMSSKEETGGHKEDPNETKKLHGVSYDYRNIGKTMLSANDEKAVVSQEAGSLKMKKLRGVSYDYKDIGKTSLSNDDDKTSHGETSKWLPGTVDDAESWNFYKNMLINSKQSEKAAKNLAVFMFCKLKKIF